jgi:predicted esterase
MFDHDHSRRSVLRATGALAGLSLAGDGFAAPDDADRDGSPRPGPSVLYGPNPTPPQLENGDGWTVEPLLVSGADAHRGGEYLYQDYVYDDHGAGTTSVPGAPPQPEPDDFGAIFSPPSGDYVYPTDAERYAHNAADLLEFRARPDGDEVVYRLTLNTMVEPDLAAVAIGIDTSAAGEGDGTGAIVDRPTDWGHGLGDLGAPVDHVLVTWGTGATLDGERLADDRVAVDVARNRIEVRVPLSPGTATWRHYCVTGLHDGDGGFQPVAARPDEETPGGAHPETPGETPPVFNVGFRFEEPFGAPNLSAATLERELRELRDARGSRGFGFGNWREHRQSEALADRDISPFHADIDFGALRRRETRERIPTSGYLSLLYPSRLELGAGVDASNDVLLSRVQPYAAYVPESATEEPSPLVLLMHSLGGSFNQYGVYSPNLVASLGEENGAIVLLPEGRGPSGWYQREAEVDVFEAWRDLETRYEIDRDRVTLSGYSMGGYGTFKLGAQYPDLFGRGFAVVGPASEDPVEGPTDGRLETPGVVQDGLLGGEEGFLGGEDGEDRSVSSVFSNDPENTLRISDNLRHVPLLLWNGVADELVPVVGPINQARRLRAHGYRHELDLFPTVDHLLLALRDRWDRGVDYLDAGAVTRDPARVTYRRVPDFDHPRLGLIHDGAYWVHDIEVRGDADSGLVDAISYADGYADPRAVEYAGSGTRPFPHSRRGVRWAGRTDDGTTAWNALAVRLEGVRTATLYVSEAGLSLAGLTLRTDSDGPTTLRLVGSDEERTVDVPAGRTARTL